MWAEVSPDRRLVWTSSGGDLLAYRTSAISRAASGAPPLRAVARISGVVPALGISGAAFYGDCLLVAGRAGALFEVTSIDLATGERRLEIPRPAELEPEGLDVVDALGGVLHWIVRPSSGQGNVLLHYVPTAPRGRLRLSAHPPRLTAGRRTACGSARRTPAVPFPGRCCARRPLGSHRRRRKRAYDNAPPALRAPSGDRHARRPARRRRHVAGAGRYPPGGPLGVRGVCRERDGSWVLGGLVIGIRGLWCSGYTTRSGGSGAARSGGSGPSSGSVGGPDGCSAFWGRCGLGELRAPRPRGVASGPRPLRCLSAMLSVRRGRATRGIGAMGVASPAGGPLGGRCPGGGRPCWRVGSERRSGANRPRRGPTRA